MLSDLRSRQAVEAAELWADSLLGAKELSRARKAAAAVERRSRRKKYFAARAAKQAAIPRKDWVRNTAWCATAAVAFPQMEEYQRHQCHLLRDIFANRFRPMPAIDSAWLSWNDGIVGKLAQAIYDERILPQGLLDQSRLAILADALEEAGCPVEDVLSHLRSDGPHVRGCWVVDLMLGKS